MWDLDNDAPYQARPFGGHQHSPPPPKHARTDPSTPSVDTPTALARAHETIEVLCDEVDHAQRRRRDAESHLRSLRQALATLAGEPE